MRKAQPLRSNQKGFASLVVALIMIIVLSLLMVGFARLARREQQNSLDKQLATQAYYASETGINDITQAIPAIKAYQAAHPDDIKPDLCLSSDQIAAINSTTTAADGSAVTPRSNINPTIDNSTDVTYTCALVNLTPDDVKETGIGVRSSRQSRFSTNGTLRQLTVSWGSHNPTHTTRRPAGSTDFLPAGTGAGNWGDTNIGVVQMSITPLGSGTISRDGASGLINSTFTAYLYPSSGGINQVDYVPATDDTNAPIVSGNCADKGAYPCKVTINNLPGGANDYYLIHLTNYYDISDVSVNNFIDDDGSTHLHAVDAQAQIDVTGKAKNVLKRIQVRTPLDQNDLDLPPAAIDSQGTCKRSLTYPDTMYGLGQTTYDHTAYSGSDVCELDTDR